MKTSLSLLPSPKALPTPLSYVIDPLVRPKHTLSRISKGNATIFENPLADLPRQLSIKGLTKYSFLLPGMGESGPNCMKNVFSAVSDDLTLLREHILYCKRAECPDCWVMWNKFRTFEITLALEIMSYSLRERPKRWMFSVHPNRVYAEAWCWKNINFRLFARGYRRSKKAGMTGGQSFYHPYRIKREIAASLSKKRREIYRSDNASRGRYKGKVGLWRLVREDALGLGSVHEYVKLGPHVHFIGFGDPKLHSSKSSVLRFEFWKDKYLLKDTKAVVSYVRYILSHVGLCKDAQAGDVASRPTRRFGCMVRLPDDFVLPPVEWIHDKCREIAGMLSMCWDPFRGLRFNTSVPLDDSVVWIPLYALREHMEGRWDRFDDDVVLFVRMLIDYVYKFGLPPPEYFPWIPERFLVVADVGVDE